MSDVQAMLDAGERKRLALGIDGTEGDAQDVQHPYDDEDGQWPTCIVCGLARTFRKHQS